MNKNKVRILSTILLDQSLVDKATEHGIDMDMMPFIEVSPIASEAIEKEVRLLYRQPAAVVFTSVNAVNAVANYKAATLPDWKIYCIGNATKIKVLELFGASVITGTAADAGQLADVIIKDKNSKEVIFFCGDKRRNELPDKLRNAGIAVKEIVLYTTTETPVKVEQEYDGVLFFSPSGVCSFFTENEAQAGTTFFAIGDTTASALKTVTTNEIVVSDKQSKEALMELVMKQYPKPQKGLTHSIL